MFLAETREITAAASNELPIDGSLPARRVGVTLLVHGAQTKTQTSTIALDALGHLASQPISSCCQILTASLLRLSVLAGPHAAAHVAACSASAIWSRSTVSDGLEICLRWVENGTLRAEFLPLPVVWHTADAFLSSVQSSLLDAAINKGVPLPRDIAASHSSVPEQGWAKAQATASEAFFGLMEGETAAVKHPAIDEHNLHLDCTGIFVRLCNRSLPDGGISDPSSFHGVNRCLEPPRAAQPHLESPCRPCKSDTACSHLRRCALWHGLPTSASSTRAGMLLANSIHAASARRFCDDYCNGLPPPDQNSISLLLHTCAVQAEGFQLASRVTLFDFHGIPGITRALVAHANLTPLALTCAGARFGMFRPASST
jgi:hypothetical protein